jgi:sulfate permease, SulP family
VEPGRAQALSNRPAPRTRNVICWLVGLNPEVLATVRNTDWHERLGRDRMLFNARNAIQRYQGMQAAEAASPTVS